MSRPIGLSNSQLAEVRTVTGVIAADSATLTDANIPTSGGFDSSGFDTVFLAVEITGGSSPTATLEILVRDEDAADGSRWKRVNLGTNAVAIGNASGLYQFDTLGRPLVFPRITAVTNSGSTSAIKILAVGGSPRDTSQLNRR